VGTLFDGTAVSGDARSLSGGPAPALLGAVKLVSISEIKAKTVIAVFKGFMVTPVLIKTVI
jgi:hypothetical protein